MWLPELQDPDSIHSLCVFACEEEKKEKKKTSPRLVLCNRRALFLFCSPFSSLLLLLLAFCATPKHIHTHMTVMHCMHYTHTAMHCPVSDRWVNVKEEEESKEIERKKKVGRDSYLEVVVLGRMMNLNDDEITHHHLQVQVKPYSLFSCFHVYERELRDTVQVQVLVLWTVSFFLQVLQAFGERGEDLMKR